MTYKSMLIAAIMALATATAPMTFAQETAEDSADAETTAAEPLTAETVTDAQVEAFVKGIIVLEAIRTEYEGKIGNAESKEAQDELRAEADRVALQYIEQLRGLSPDEYIQITKLAPTSEELTKRISAQVEVMREQKAEFEKKQAEARKAKDAQRAEEARKAAEDTAKEATTSE